MPIKTKNGKWKWGNVERSSKKELVQTVYGIWKKNGSKGSFSKFLKGTHESNEKLDLFRIPEDSMLDIYDIQEYKGSGFKEYNYLANCIGGEGTLFDDASEMASWINNFCQVIPIEKVKDRLNGAPSELVNAMKKLEQEEKLDDLDEIVCAIDAVKQGYHEPRDMMFIYVSDQDIHYFFECLGALSDATESYEPPYTLDTIKQKYGDEVYRKLRDDPVHRFRAETGIEVIHKEPTKDEFERIVKNWDLMTPEQKKQSDEFSMKQFGKNNKDRIDNIRKEYLKEYWDKRGRYIYCADCHENLSKAPDDQYIMISDKLWSYVCKHGGKEIEEEDHLCRDCIEKRLGRPLTLKDLGDKINLPINDEFKKILKKRKMKKESIDEAAMIHSYPETLQPIIDRIVKGNEEYELDHAYFNKEGKFIWMRNSKGYFHIFKPVKLKNVKWKPFAFRDLILQDDGMMKPLDLIQFNDGHEGLKYLQTNYHFNANTMI